MKKLALFIALLVILWAFALSGATDTSACTIPCRTDNKTTSDESQPRKSCATTTSTITMTPVYLPDKRLGGFGDCQMYYFAYGSNLSQKQMLERCPDALPKFLATLPNYKLIFAGWSRKWSGGVASIKPSKGEKVMGGVYEITERCLRKLDGYEGYPTVYSRMNIRVFTDLGDPVDAITYIKVEQSKETPPSPKYLATIQQGYRDWEIV